MAITTTATTTLPQQQQQLPCLSTIESSTTTAATTTTTTMVVVSDYEQTREQRIKENRERLQKLGIVDLSLQLKSISSTASRRTTPKSSFDRKTPLKSPSLGPIEPRRRSSRLQNAPPVAYVEPKEEKSRGRSRDIMLEVGSKPEFYTEEHEKLLGNTEMPWTFFVDGYAPDGTRIYDPVKGKTCHQCRQKTLGQRTRCCQCNLVQGQFCGDCLYMRYGEHVVEANQNPNWICPPCRGICNCSLCRQAKGWPATGALYRRISRLGYKSVAHYLMATKRAPPKEDTIAEKCLPFEGMQVPTDNASDEKAADEINVTPDTEPNQTPEESVMNGDVVEDVIYVEKKPVGRPRKRSMEENFDTDVAVHVEKRPVGRPRKRLENDDAGVVIQVQERVHVEKRPIGRPRKRSMEENFDADEVVHIKKKPIGRQRKRSMEENLNSDEEPLSTDVEKNELQSSTSVADNPSGDKATDETPESVVNGEENLNSDEEPLSTDVKKNELHSSTSMIDNASDDKATDESNANPDTEPNETPKSVVNGEMAQDVLVLVKKRPVGRPRKGSEKENVNIGEEPSSTDIKKNGVVSEMQSPHGSTIAIDSVARRLRPRNKA